MAFVKLIKCTIGKLNVENGVKTVSSTKDSNERAPFLVGTRVLNGCFDDVGRKSC